MGNVTRGAIAILAAAAALSAAPAAGEPASAERIVRSAGARGGLCVHLGVTDGRLTADLRSGGRFVVHGLTDAAPDAARKHVRARGLTGAVSIERGGFRRLPHADGLVNLLVADDLPRLWAKGLTAAEMLRVLAPGGVAYVGSAGGGEGVADALRAKLSAGGAGEFEIVRRAGVWAKLVKPRPAGMDDWGHWRHGPDGNMVSRDTLVGIPNRLKWIAAPAWARSHALIGCSRALVSAGGRMFFVYDAAPRGYRGPMRMTLIARDAANGLPLWRRAIESTTPDGIAGKRQERYWDGKYYWYRRRSLVATADRVYTVLKQGGSLVALDAASGKVLKTYDQAGSPDEVVVAGGRLVLIRHTKRLARYGRGLICCVDAATGAVRWRNDTDSARYPVVVGDDVFYEASKEIVRVGLAGGKEKWRAPKPAGARVLCFHHDGKLILKGQGKDLYALSAGDGGALWSYQYKDFNGAWYSDTDVYAVGGLIWVQVGGERWAMVGLDPATGAEKRRIDFPAEYPKTRGHHRCHPNRATARHFVLDTHGLDFVDHRSGKVCDLRVYRGNCYVGVLPANGLLYVPPNACQCGEYFRGFMALASAGEAGPVAVTVAKDGRFERGPAFATAGGKPVGRDDWPTHRHDSTRSGATAGSVPAELAPLWSRKVGGRLTSATVAGGTVFVASIDAHEVHALDARSGEPRWRHTAGGRVDSPPTIHDGLVLFGCRNGWVTCLRAADGKLVWRYRAAPRERRIAAVGQVESAWPVHGSVLVHRGVAYFAAGRSSELDGGLYVHAVEPRTGKVLWEGRSADSLAEIVAGKIWKGYVPVCLNDVMTAKGGVVSVGYTGFETATGKIKPRTYSWWARSGMLDRDSWTGRVRWRGRGLQAELLVFDRKTGYGLLTPAGSERLIDPGKREHKLLAKGAHQWEVQLPLRVRAMALTAGALFVAGTPDVVDDQDYWAALEGRRGGELWAVDPADGRKLASLKLDAAPVFDGLSAAGGRLYLTTRDGRLRCFGRTAP